MIYGADYRTDLKCLVFAVSNYHVINIAEGNVTLIYPVDAENNGCLFNEDVEGDSFAKSEVRALLIYNDNVTLYIQFTRTLCLF